MYLYVALLVFLVMFLSSAIRILNDYERGVVQIMVPLAGTQGEYDMEMVPRDGQ